MFFNGHTNALFSHSRHQDSIRSSQEVEAGLPLQGVQTPMNFGVSGLGTLVLSICLLASASLRSRLLHPLFGVGCLCLSAASALPGWQTKLSKTGPVPSEPTRPAVSTAAFTLVHRRYPHPPYGFSRKPLCSTAAEAPLRGRCGVRLQSHTRTPEPAGRGILSGRCLRGAFLGDPITGWNLNLSLWSSGPRRTIWILFAFISLGVALCLVS